MAANTKLEESLRRLGMTEVADDPGSVARLSKRLGDKMAAALANIHGPAGSLVSRTAVGDLSMRRKKVVVPTMSVHKGTRMREMIQPGIGGEPLPPEEKSARVIADKLLTTVAVQVGTPANLAILDESLKKCAGEAGMVTASECQSALRHIGAHVSEADLPLLTHTAGSQLVDAPALVSLVAARLPRARTEAVGPYPGPFLQREAVARAKGRVAVTSEDSKAAGYSVRRRNVGHESARHAGVYTEDPSFFISSEFANGADLYPSGFKGKRTAVHRPTGGVDGAKETIFYDATHEAVQPPSPPSDATFTRRLLERVQSGVAAGGGPPALSAALSVVDNDHDGSLTKKEFRKALVNMGIPCSPAEAAALFKVIKATVAPSSRAELPLPQETILAGLAAPSPADLAGPILPSSPDADVVMGAFGQLMPKRKIMTTDRRKLQEALQGSDLDAQPDALYDVHMHKLSTRAMKGFSGEVRGSRDSLGLDAAGYAVCEQEVAMGKKRHGDAVPVHMLVHSDLAWDTQAPPGGVSESESRLRASAVLESLRRALPTDPAAARVHLRRTLRALDGDNDGKLSVSELSRGALTALGARGSFADIIHLARYLYSNKPYKNNTPPRAVYEAEMGCVDINDFVDFVSEGAVSPAKSSRPPLKVTTADAATDPPTPVRRPTHEPSSTSKAEKERFAVFRVAWESKHGPAGRKEMAMDAARESSGETWTAFEPKPFKVVHLKDEAPSPLRG